MFIPYSLVIKHSISFPQIPIFNTAGWYADSYKLSHLFLYGYLIGKLGVVDEIF